MNIPDDPFFTLLNDALAARGAETLQRHPVRTAPGAELASWFSDVGRAAEHFT